MKIKDALIVAASQFIQQFGNKARTLQVLEQFAVEELELDRDHAKKFSEGAIEGQAKEWPVTEEDRNKFFTWYLINHVDLRQNLQHNSK